MHGVIVYVLGVAGLLALVSVLPSAAARLRLPYAVVLAAVGLALGVTIKLAPGGFGPGPAADFLQSLQSLEISSGALLYLFLPVLLFETAVAVPVRRLIEDIAPVLTMAVVAVFVCTLFIGVALRETSGMGWAACLLVGTLLATTDPGAVIGVFRDLGAPRRLMLLVEGESLLNDAAAIGLFSLLLTLLTMGGRLTLDGIAWTFFITFFGGAAVGWAMGRVACFIAGRLDGRLAAEITLTVALAYLSYAVGEHYFHVSGVVAVVAAALTVGSVGRTRLSQATWGAMEHVWGQLGFWANSMIFLLTALVAPQLFVEVTWTEVGLIFVVAAAALAARAVVVFGFLPLLSAVGAAQQVSFPYKAVMTWGGLRGAISLTLALAVTENTLIAEEVKHFVAVLAIGYVMLTLFVNGVSLRPLIAVLGLDRLSPVETAMRGRALAAALSGVRERVLGLGQCYSAERAVIIETVKDYDARIKGQDEAAAIGLCAQDRLMIGLRILANREEEEYLRSFADGAVSRPVVEWLLSRAGRLADAARAQGVDGYRRAAEDYLAYTYWLRLANWLHSRFGVNGPLAKRLTMRFEALVTMQIVLTRLLAFADGALAAVLGEDLSHELSGVLLARREETLRGLDALRRQYPEFAHIMQGQYIGRAALRLEESEYRNLHAESVISEDVLLDLERDLHRRRRALEAPPQLDLRMDVPTLLSRVKLFEGLAAERLAEVAALLRPRLVLPGETLIRRGERGDCMYFIASGAVEVLVPGLDHPVHLGTGDVFGEMALLTRERRNADVRALGYGQLLTLHARDFHRLMKRDADLHAHIRAVAAARKSAMHKPADPQPVPDETNKDVAA
jgi:monovalent cation:H+ antiporter, CPA1 family